MSEVVEFDGLRFDMQQRTLSRGFTRIDLPKKLGDLLGYLIENRHRTVPKHELLRALWAGESVSASVVPNSVAALRRAIGHSGDDEAPLQTVRGRGYRFSAALREVSAVATPPAGLGEPVFVGRHQTLAQLIHSLQKLRDGRGGVVLIAGPPGIGKTRLLDELLGATTSPGVRQVSARCTEMRMERPLAPLMRAISGLGLELPAAITALRYWPSAGARVRFSLSERVAQGLVDEAQVAPIVIRLEDLQWSDEATLQVLQLLSLRAPERALLVLATVRTAHLEEDSQSHQLSKLLRSERVVRHYLRPLPRAHVAQLFDKLRPEQSVAHGVAEPSGVAGGNQLVISETSAADEMVSARPFDDSDLQLPESAVEPAREQLDLLDESVHRVLLFAATLGRGFAVGHVAALLEQSVAAVLSACDIARAAGVIVLRDGGRGEFASRALYEACYRGISAGQRAVLHSRAAVLLSATMIAGDLNSAINVTLHELRALPFGDVERAVAQALNGAKEARARGGYVFARRLLDLALQASAGAFERGLELRAQLHVERVLLSYANGDVVAARQGASEMYDESLGRFPEGMVLGAALWTATSDFWDEHDAVRNAVSTARLALGPEERPELSRLLVLCAQRLASDAPVGEIPQPFIVAPDTEQAPYDQALVAALFDDGRSALQEASLVRGSLLEPKSLLPGLAKLAHDGVRSGRARGALRPATVLELGRERRIGRLSAWGRLRLGDRAGAERALESSPFGPPGQPRDPWAGALLRAELARLEGRYDESVGYLSQLTQWQVDPWAERGRAQLIWALGQEGAPSQPGHRPQGLVGRLRRKLEAGAESFVGDAVARLASNQAAGVDPFTLMQEFTDLSLRAAEVGNWALRKELLSFFAPLSGTFVVTRTLHVRCAVDYLRGLLLSGQDDAAAFTALCAARDQTEQMRAVILLLPVERALGDLPGADPTHAHRVQTLEAKLMAGAPNLAVPKEADAAAAMLRESHGRP